MSECPICGGTGERIVQIMHPLSKKMKLASEMCLCQKSLIVSSTPNYGLLSYLGGTYLPVERLDPRFKFTYPNVYDTPNLLIHSSSFDLFCLHIKTFLMLNRFVDPAPSIYCCHAIDIVHDFLVPQEDGRAPHLSAVDSFHLFIFTMDTSEKNEGLTTSVAQVVYKRKMIRKPTWIFQPTSELSSCKEYSSELDGYLKSYSHITLKDIEIKKKISKSQDNAANFNP